MFTVDDATHDLKCEHRTGHRRTRYKLKCLVLRTLPKGMVEVLVFGTRPWRDDEHVTAVRCVPVGRISKRTD